MDAPFHLPTPPTLEQRLDAAAEEYRNRHMIPSPDDKAWAELSDGVKHMYRSEVSFICRAFAPEHFKDPHNETGKD